jgi:hypothetical protein
VEGRQRLPHAAVGLLVAPLEALPDRIEHGPPAEP